MAGRGLVYSGLRRIYGGQNVDDLGEEDNLAMLQDDCEEMYPKSYENDYDTQEGERKLKLPEMSDDAFRDEEKMREDQELQKLAIAKRRGNISSEAPETWLKSNGSSDLLSYLRKTFSFSSSKTPQSKIDTEVTSQKLQGFLDAITNSKSINVTAPRLPNGEYASKGETLGLVLDRETMKIKDLIENGKESEIQAEKIDALEKKFKHYMDLIRRGKELPSEEQENKAARDILKASNVKSKKVEDEEQMNIEELKKLPNERLVNMVKDLSILHHPEDDHDVLEAQKEAYENKKALDVTKESMDEIIKRHQVGPLVDDLPKRPDPKRSTELGRYFSRTVEKYVGSVKTRMDRSPSAERDREGAELRSSLLGLCSQIIYEKNETVLEGITASMSESTFDRLNSLVSDMERTVVPRMEAALKKQKQDYLEVGIGGILDGGLLDSTQIAPVEIQDSARVEDMPANLIDDGILLIKKREEVKYTPKPAPEAPKTQKSSPIPQQSEKVSSPSPTPPSNEKVSSHPPLLPFKGEPTLPVPMQPTSSIPPARNADLDEKDPYVYAKLEGSGDKAFHIVRLKTPLRTPYTEVRQRYARPYFCVNGFYHRMREDFVTPGAQVMYYILSWEDDAFSWEDFRERFLGATDPTRAARGSLRNEIYRNWAELGLESKPSIAANSVHGSASAFEALLEQKNWCDTELSSLRFFRALTSLGVSLETLRGWAKDPVVVLGDDEPVSLFDAMENKGAKGCLEIAKSLRISNMMQAETKSGLCCSPTASLRNKMDIPKIPKALLGREKALIFLKPNAVTEKVSAFVRQKARDWGMFIEAEGIVEAEEIREKGIIDRHYYAIADKAMIRSPNDMNPDANRAENFAKEFGIPWKEAVEQGIVYNSVECAKRLGLLQSGVTLLWDKAKKAGDIVKLGGGFYCAKLRVPINARGFRFKDFSQSLISYFGEKPSVNVEWHGKIHKISNLSNILPAGDEIHLLAAASKGDYKRMQEVMARGVPVDAKDPHQRTALYGAAANGHLGIINLLLSQGADPNAENSQTTTPLYIATQHGHTSVVARLLKAGADPNHQTKTGTTALHMAVDSGHYEIAKELIKNGADPNLKTSSDVTALYIAVHKNRTKIFQLLLENDALTEYMHQGEHVPVSIPMAAARFGRNEMLRMLLEKKCDIDQVVGGASMLTLAAQFNLPQTVELLMAYGADAELRAAYKLTALGVAAKFGHGDVGRVLLRLGADPENVAGENDSPPLVIAAACGQTEMVDVLLEYGADLESKTSSGATALHAAVQHGGADMVHFLLEKGADPNAKTSNGVTPAEVAKYTGKKTILAMLRDAGADEPTSPSPHIQERDIMVRAPEMTAEERESMDSKKRDRIKKPIA
eukprot:CAMPEP_0167743464 /NCGR_PEP_ID=MMETSP0110_2-20121227/2030_1 /TAXON_ID=629695 /ORGANISM="Gymnochlora sp., Strain CCMP2014" /LENGTH=1371 /DNA_ID=CAMNT_0007627837 /DNA_START=148 /DNA_END=4263 /DNA_ORIENTATION=-